MDEWTESIVASMSTAELCSALRGVDAAEERRHGPSPELVARMAEEWNDRPARDRIAAEAMLGDST